MRFFKRFFMRGLLRRGQLFQRSFSWRQAVHQFAIQSRRRIERRSDSGQLFGRDVPHSRVALCSSCVGKRVSASESISINAGTSAHHTRADVFE